MNDCAQSWHHCLYCRFYSLSLEDVCSAAPLVKRRGMGEVVVGVAIGSQAEYGAGEKLRGKVRRREGIEESENDKEQQDPPLWKQVLLW